MPWLSSGTPGIGADHQPWAFDHSGQDVKDQCAGAGGYSDIAEGAAVTIRDANDKIIGNASLGTGTTKNLTHAWGPCVLHFTTTVSSGSDFYTVEVSHREKVTFSAKELDHNRWRPALTIGG